jgi:hypothetical protein
MVVMVVGWGGDSRKPLDLKLMEGESRIMQVT